MTAAQPPAEAQLASGTRWIAFAGLNIALSIVVIGQSAVSVALPVLAREFDVPPATAVWVANAYLLVLSVLLLPFSSIAGRIGYRRVYLSGLTVLILASALAAMATSFEMLLGARVLQGLGAAGTISVNLSLVRNIFPAARFGTAIGIIGVIGALSNSAGPVIAATILSFASWQWLFLMNVPLALVALGIALRMLPETGRHPGRFRPLSAVLHVATIGLLIVGLDRLGKALDDPWVPLALLAAAVVSAGIYLRHELRLEAPLLPVALLRRPAVALSVGTCILIYQVQSLVVIVLPFVFLDLLGLPLIEAGFLLTPLPVATMLAAPFVGWLVDRYRSEIPCSIGIALMLAGVGALASLPAEPGTLDIVWLLALVGVGFAFFQTPNHKIIMESAPRERTAEGGGVLTTSRLIGQSSGTALAAMALAMLTIEGASLILGCAAGLAAAALVVSTLRLHPRLADRTQEAHQ